jgi:phage terminase large subunit-like protein
MCELRADLPLYVGIDIGLKHDSAAVYSAQRDLLTGRTIVRGRVWENPYPPSHAGHSEWKLAIFEVENYLRELRKQYPVPAAEVDEEVREGPAFGYDPFFFERSAQVLTGEGLNMVEFPQNDSRMVPASQNFYDLIVTGALSHNGDSVLKRHVGNVIADIRPRGYRMSKHRGNRMKKIDAAIACAIAAYLAQTQAPKAPTSVYEEREMLVL